MIIESLLSMFMSIITPLISKIPVVDIEVPAGIMGWILDVFSAFSMFLPVKTMLTIFALSFLITNFSIIYKVIMKFWNALPLT